MASGQDFLSIQPTSGSAIFVHDVPMVSTMVTPVGVGPHPVNGQLFFFSSPEISFPATAQLGPSSAPAPTESIAAMQGRMDVILSMLANLVPQPSAHLLAPSPLFAPPLLASQAMPLPVPNEPQLLKRLIWPLPEVSIFPVRMRNNLFCPRPWPNYWRDYDTALFILKHLYRDTPEDGNSPKDSSQGTSKDEIRSSGWSNKREIAEEELPLTFSDSMMVRNFSRKAKRFVPKTWCWWMS